MFAVGIALYAIKMLRMEGQIGADSRMNVGASGVVLPDGELRLDLHIFDTVHGHDIKLPYGLIVFRRVSGSHDEPPLRYRMIAESLILEELEHDRGEGLGDAVDLIDKKNAGFVSAVLHILIN